jgi:hypothetical protein
MPSSRAGRHDYPVAIGQCHRILECFEQPSRRDRGRPGAVRGLAGPPGPRGRQDGLRWQPRGRGCPEGGVRRSRPRRSSTRETLPAVTTSRSSVPLTVARCRARTTASAPAWSQETVTVMSAISVAAPRLMTDSSPSRTCPAVSISEL